MSGEGPASIPRPEYPRPQFVREDWLCLNGSWGFEIDSGDCGLEGGLLDRELQGQILVPFCPESELSGVGERCFMEAVWYRRTFAIPKRWLGRRLLLHFQAVDHDATVWVDGEEVARHRGGFTPFSADLGVATGQRRRRTIVVRARDPSSGAQPRGKQSDRPENYGCLYTRTTGIWQTVWVEPVPGVYMLRPRITPRVVDGAFDVQLALHGRRRGLRVRVTLSAGSEILACAQSVADPDFSVSLRLEIPSAARRLWSPADPFLYHLRLELLGRDGELIDQATSYAGLRALQDDGAAILLNGRPVFQRLVLDQGYYPDGIMTAPSDAALARDIELALAAGFNGARLHQKVFEERFLYHCDRLGYLVWGEFGDWGGRPTSAAPHLEPTPTFITQWLEVLARDYSHPAVIGWCPLNETTEAIQPRPDRLEPADDVQRGMFLAAKAIDQTRPVLDASGWAHRVREADVYDGHSYEQDPARLVRELAALRALPGSLPHRGQPFLLSEAGGIWWNPDADAGAQSWGYGDPPRSAGEFYRRFEELVSLLLDDASLCGYCYTQLTDVYQEQNGIYRFDRAPKFDIARIRGAQARLAALETS